MNEAWATVALEKGPKDRGGRGMMVAMAIPYFTPGKPDDGFP
jgi:hypothetical protein